MTADNIKPASTDPTILIGTVNAVISSSTSTQAVFTIPANIASGVYEITVRNSNNVAARKWVAEV